MQHHAGANVPYLSSAIDVSDSGRLGALFQEPERSFRTTHSREAADDVGDGDL